MSSIDDIGVSLRYRIELRREFDQRLSSSRDRLAASYQLIDRTAAQTRPVFSPAPPRPTAPKNAS